jgi:hypothetical protein
MSAVNNIYSTNTAPAGYTAEGIVGNLSKVLKEIYPQKADNMVAQGMITEEQLFASFAFGEIEKKRPKLANAILGDLKEQFLALKKSGDIRPLYHAMEKAISNAVSRGKLSAKDGQEIIKVSLGMAQLDSKEQYLSARRIKFEDQGTVAAGTTYMDRILGTIADNKSFDGKDLKAAESRMASLDAKGHKYNPQKGSEIVVAFKGASSGGVVTETTVPVSDGSEIEISANRFGYWPSSSSAGGVKIQVPADLAVGAWKIEILSRDGSSVLESSDVNIQTSEGAKRAKFSKKGEEYGDSLRVKIHWIDGKTYERLIEDSSKVFQRLISN